MISRLTKSEESWRKVEEITDVEVSEATRLSEFSEGCVHNVHTNTLKVTVYVLGGFQGYCRGRSCSLFWRICSPLWETVPTISRTWFHYFDPESKQAVDTLLTIDLLGFYYYQYNILPTTRIKLPWIYCVPVFEVRFTRATILLCAWHFNGGKNSMNMTGALLYILLGLTGIGNS